MPRKRNKLDMQLYSMSDDSSFQKRWLLSYHGPSTASTACAERRHHASVVDMDFRPVKRAHDFCTELCAKRAHKNGKTRQTAVQSANHYGLLAPCALQRFLASI
eukprot:6177662-Pleurochrysis_carterae.AAC.2